VVAAEDAGGPARGTAWVVWGALFVALPTFGRGGTLGQRTVLLHPVLPDGRRPSRARLLTRSLTGTGGFLLLQNLGSGAVGLGVLWGLVGLVGIIRTRDHRGVGEIWTGTVLQDRRLEAHRADPVIALDRGHIRERVPHGMPIGHGAVPDQNYGPSSGPPYVGHAQARGREIARTMGVNS
jgi:hypothetical protein